jgi:hypothetical protein
LRDTRRGKNTVHRLDGLFRQSVFGRLAGYEDVNDADRLALDPVMRQVVGGRAVDAQAASASQMGRFETETLAQPENRAALADLNGQWIDRFHDRNGLKYIVLDMDSSVSPTHGDQEGAAWNGHFDCTCYHPNFCSTSSACWSAAPCAMATSTAPMAGGTFSTPSSPATRARPLRPVLPG